MLCAARRFCWETYSLISALLCFIYLSLCLSVLCAFSLYCGGWSIFQWSVISVPGLFIRAVYIKDLRWAAPGAAVACRSMCRHAEQWTYSMYGQTLSVMQPRPVLPPQLTQLGQQTTHHNSPNYPAAPLLVQLPQWAMLIYNGAYVTGSSMCTLHCPHTQSHTNSTQQEGMHSSICMSVLLVTSQQWGCVSTGLILPQSLPPAAI